MMQFNFWPVTLNFIRSKLHILNAFDVHIPILVSELLPMTAKTVHMDTTCISGLHTDLYRAQEILQQPDP